jgi:hypothetical protein
MASTKRLRSVIQSTAHHAMSGLCYVTQHLGVFCEARQLDRATVDLLAGTVVTSDGIIAKPLRLSADALSKRFVEILNAEGIEVSDLHSATIEFHFKKWACPLGCHIRVETTDGLSLEDTSDELGRRAENLKARA